MSNYLNNGFEFTFPALACDAIASAIMVNIKGGIAAIPKDKKR